MFYSRDVLCLLFMKLTKKEFFVILITWLIATSVNITKPFHIDDAYHLEAAIHILNDPLKPSSGFINWINVPEPLSQSNQPPLIFYLIALTGYLTSFNEIPLHLLISVFTFLALYFFFLTVRLLKPGDAGLFTILLGLSPAFLVNQNIMVDIPLLSATLAFGYFCILAAKSGKFSHLAYAGVALGLAILTKFTIIPLFVVILIIPFFYKKPLHSLVVFIPVGFIVAWSLYNIYEFNDIHILTRQLKESSFGGVPDTALSFLSCIGSISPFALMMFAATQKNPRKYIPYIVAIFVLFILFILISWFGLITDEFSKEIIRYIFMLSGLVVVISLIIANKHIFKDLVNRTFVSNTRIFLVLWFSSLTLFIILFAPFIATRHVLLILPAYLLMIPALKTDFPNILKGIALTATITTGILLSISDYQYALFYKKHAQDIAKKYSGEDKIWALGHWGWQWYSRLNGMKIYNTCISNVKEGDIMVLPSKVPIQQMCPLIKMEQLEARWDEPGILSFFSTRNEGSFYISSYKRPAWRLTLMPTDTIIVNRVTEIIKSPYKEHDHAFAVGAW